MPARRRSFRATFLTCVALGLGCSNDAAEEAESACGHSAAELVGGWRAPFAIRACFAADHRMWIGDSDYELQSRSHCTTTADACRYECTDLAGGAPYGGTLEVTGDVLRVGNDDCLAGPGACVGVYSRDASVTCQ